MGNENIKGVEKIADDIIKEVVPGLTEDKRHELINKLSGYLHINASMLTLDESPDYVYSKNTLLN